MASTSEARMQSIQSALKAVMTAKTITCPAAWPNAPFDKPNSGMWLQIDLIDNDEEQVSIGTNPMFRASGFLAIQIFDDVEKGEHDIRAIYDKLVDGMASRSTSDVIYRSPKQGDSGRFGAWHRKTLVIPWWSDYCKV